MRRVDHRRLALREAGVERTYEVELADVGDGRFVVNTRQGRSGALRDGTLTPKPVPEARARALFAQAIADRETEGYRTGDAPLVAAPVALAAPIVAPSNAGRAQRLLARLKQGAHGAGSIERVMWRVGEVGLRDAEPMLLELLAVKPVEARRLFANVWALGRCGSPRALEALEALADNGAIAPHVRELAAEAALLVAGEGARRRLIAAALASLPEAARTALRSGTIEALASACEQAIARGDQGVLSRLYRVDDPGARAALLAILARVALTSPAFASVRRIFKAAELRGDGEVFGLIAWRIETTPAATASYPRGGVAFTRTTRHYLRRRVARTLRRLGQLGAASYAPMAVGVLLAFRDADAVAPQTRRYHQYRRAPRSLAWDRYAPYLAFNQVLFAASPRFVADRHGRAWRCRPGVEPGAPAPATREEGFPALWDAQPQALLQLATESACAPVHDFAARALRANPSFTAGLDDAIVIRLLASPYAPTADLGLALAEPRPRSHALLVALADCDLAPARALVHAWLDAHRAQLIVDTALLAALVVSRHVDNRWHARDFLRAAALADDVARVLVTRVIAAIQDLGATAEDDARAGDAATVLLRGFGAIVATLGVDVIRDLLAHPLAAVQELAAELIANHATLATAVPDDLLLALIDSPHPRVRAVGVRLLAQLPLAELAAYPELFVELSTRDAADLRGLVRPLIARIAAEDPRFGERVADELRQLLMTPLPEGVPAHVVSLLRHELRDHLGAPDRDDVLRLLGARSPHAQELGGLLLERLAPDELTLAEIVRLASHEIRGVREAAWALCRGSVDRFRAAMPALAKLFDAAWDDSRQFAGEFLASAFRDEDYTAAMLVTLCDSVRPDVQRYGRDLIAQRFREADGATYLLRLGEHPAAAIQLFVTNYLDRFAAGDAARLAQLEPYFVRVLSRVNTGAVAKRRCLEFLVREGTASEGCAVVAARIFARQSATCSIRDREALLAGMVAIRRAFPQIALPIRSLEVERRAV
ncbi:MAG: hypothetical protein K8W52_45215 [Deltaproteobacteria bacterium]|nr:hypothetical protein [Deltaproteobacteria bacterium]